MDRSLLLLRLQRGCFAAVAAVAEDGTGGGDVDDDELLEEAAAAPPEAIGPLMGGCIDDAVTDGQSWGTAGSMPSGKASKLRSRSPDVRGIRRGGRGGIATGAAFGSRTLGLEK